MFFQPPAPHYFSQMGEDAFLDQQVFGGKRHGFFIDIGAHDGLTFSNTYFLEKERGWQGICIEPLPEMFAKLSANRQALCLNVGISNKKGTQEFLQVSGAGNAEMFSGLVHTYDKRHLAKVKKEAKLRHGQTQVIKIKTQQLSEIIKTHGLTHVDYCNIDTEGGELDILKTINFGACSFDCFTVEDLYGSSALKKFMKKNGFYLLKRLDVDCVYVNINYKPRAWKNDILGAFLRDYSF